MNGPLCAVCAAAILALAAHNPSAEEDGAESSESAPGIEADGGIGAAQAPQKKPRARPRLVISSDGVRLEEPGKPERRFDTIQDLVREAPWVGGIFLVKGRSATGKPLAEPTAGKIGVTRSMQAGEIPLAEIARFLSDYTGLPVITGGGPALADRTVLVASTTRDVDAEFVKQLLKTNGIIVTEEAVGLDEKALFLEPADAPNAGLGEPVPRPVVAAEGERGRRESAQPPRRGVRRAEGPEPKEGMFHGLGLVSVPEVLAAQLPIEEGRGVLVASVDDKALAAERDLKRLRVHDVITHLNEDTVDSPEEFQEALLKIPPGAPIDMRILRKGITRILRTERAHR
jgi:hypothetical protein